MKYIANGLSGQMMSSLGNCTINREILSEKPNFEGFVSCIGHEDLAKLIGVEYNRSFISLNYGDTLVVAQIMGGRLPEGATKIPNGMWIEYHKYTFE